MGWQDRVSTEYSELLYKTDKLQEFIGSSKFNEIPTLQQNLLKSQQVCMEQYSDILAQRLNK